MLRINKSIIEAVIAHAAREYPCEACGYLAEKDGLVCAYYPLTNTEKAVDHFSMDPAEQFVAVKKMRDAGETLRAVYHSHPHTPARPSTEDIRLAHDPRISYVIISLAEKRQHDIKSFTIRHQEIFPEEINMVEE